MFACCLQAAATRVEYICHQSAVYLVTKPPKGEGNAVSYCSCFDLCEERYINAHIVMTHESK